MQASLRLEGYEQQKVPSPWPVVRGDQIMRAGRYRGDNKTFHTILVTDQPYCKWVLDHVQTLEDVSMRAFARFLMQHYQRAQTQRGRDPLGDQRLAVHNPYQELASSPAAYSAPPNQNLDQAAALQQMMGQMAVMMEQMTSPSSQSMRGSAAAASTAAAAAADLKQEPLFRPRRAREEERNMEVEMELPEYVEGCTKGDMGWRNLSVSLLHKRCRWGLRMGVAAHAAAMSR